MYADVIDPVVRVLRETLRVVRAFERPQKQVEALQAVLRKLMMIRELHTSMFVSVAGLQGVGKTRLVCELYGLEAWLDDNSGRGEKRPLFVIESDCHEAYAVGITADGVEERIDRATLQAELRGFSIGMRYQLLRLYVPFKHLHPGSGFLLLPGYERKNTSNEHWQEEMRNTLRHSIGSILVTDQTRLADHATVGILDDLFKNCFANRSPITVITRTEGKTVEERQALRQTAAEVCRVPESEMDRVVCTGVGEAWRGQWLPVLTKAIHKYLEPPMEINRQRLADLKTLVDEELEEAVLMLEELVSDAALRVTGKDLLLDGIMKKFRESADKYRRNLERKLRERSQSYASLVSEVARKQYMKEEEGFTNKVRNTVTRFKLNTSEIDQRYVERVTRNWASQGERTPLEVTYLALTDMAHRNLRLDYKKGRIPEHSDLAQISSQGMPSLLGYEGSEGAIKQFEVDIDSEQLQKSLRLLLQKVPSELDSLNSQRAGSTEITRALELMPTLAMEFLRVAQASILAVGPSQLPALKDEPIEPEKLVENISKGFSGMAKNGKEVLGTILAITAVDVGIDGSFDIGTLLAGGQITGLGGTLSVAAASVIALAYVGFKVSQAVHQFDTDKKNFIAFCVDHLASQQVEQVLLTYDDVIEELQDRITQNLSRAYGIDKDIFSERDALARTLYSLKVARRDLAVEIDRAQSYYLV